MGYREITRCRCCDNEVQELLDLNDQPLANSYHEIDEELRVYPLKLNVCNKCFHTQLSIVVDPDIMFRNYLYVSGTTETLNKYFKGFVGYTLHYYSLLYNKDPKNVLDIGCNDGTQLNYYQDRGLDTYGIDPSQNLYKISSKRHNVICDYFPSKNLGYKKFDLIIAQNVFAHTDNIKGFLDKCYELLSDKGVLFIQTSQADMIKNGEFDTIYHEHLSFFNVLSMKTITERCKLYINDVVKHKIHGTSYIFLISKKQTNIDFILNKENLEGLNDMETYLDFANKSLRIKDSLKETINKYKEEYNIIGYGAAAKGNTLLNFAGIKEMDFIIDDNPLKQELYTPGTNIPIKNIDYLDFVEGKILFVPLSWNFYDEIYKRIKNKRDNKEDIFLKYFPEITINK